VDQRIIASLVADARSSYADIGARVSLSAPAVKRRVDRLRAAGVPVEHIHYDGVPHEFFGMGAVLDVAEAAQDRVAAELHTVFNPSGQSSSGWPTGL